MTFTVRVEGGERRLGFDFPAAAAAWAEDAEPLALRALRDAAPVGPGPGAGRLRGSIRAQRTAGAGSLTIEFSSDAPYAGFVVAGTAAHAIEARNARALRWEGPGGVVFARSVQHPGTRPDDFPRRALGPLARVLQARLAEAIARQLSE